MSFQVAILISSFIIAVVLGIIIIPILRKLKVGQIERDDGPKSHLAKQGTPTMGGIIIMLTMLISVILAYIYYISKDTLYYFNPLYGEKPLLKYSEWEFNNTNMIFID